MIDDQRLVLPKDVAGAGIDASGSIAAEAQLGEEQWLQLKEAQEDSQYYNSNLFLL